MGSLKDHYFGDRPYPQNPGWKEPTTSKAAAKVMVGKASELRKNTLAAFARSGMFGLTADEVATEIGASVLAVRPRVSELAAENIIVRTEERRANASGLKAAVWRVR